MLFGRLFTLGMTIWLSTIAWEVLIRSATCVLVVIVKLWLIARWRIFASRHFFSVVVVILDGCIVVAIWRIGRLSSEPLFLKSTRELKLSFWLMLESIPCIWSVGRIVLSIAVEVLRCWVGTEGGIGAVLGRLFMH